MNYAVIVFDESGSRVAKLENATNPTYSRSKNSADQIEISVPRGDPKIPEVSIGRRFEIIRHGDILEASGYVGETGYDGERYVIGGLSEEIVLSRFLVPDNYGYPLWSENQTLDGMFDLLGRSFTVERVKRNWASYDVGSSNIDYASEPDFVLLASYASQPSTGYIELRFQKTSDQRWERIRWVSDYSDEVGVTSTVRYRVGSSPGGGSYSTPVAGALTDVVGIVPADQANDYLDVRVDLDSTADEISPVLFAVEVVKSEPMPDVTSITYDASASSTTSQQVDANLRSNFEVASDLCEAVDWEFRLIRGVLEFKPTFGTNRTNDYSMVES